MFDNDEKIEKRKQAHIEWQKNQRQLILETKNYINQKLKKNKYLEYLNDLLNTELSNL